jgi:uncharacterized protein YndB with AHSA1/START domain
MVDILHRIGIDARPEKVFAALTRIEGLRGWWVSTATGNGETGGTVDFGFCQMKVVAAQPGERVHWKCVGGPDEWVGTEVDFRLAWKMDQTFVLFAHTGWKEPVEFMHHSSTKRASFLFSLMELVERGSGRPTPYDFKIHVGD